MLISPAIPCSCLQRSHAHVSSGPMPTSPAVPCSRLQLSHAHVSSCPMLTSPAVPCPRLQRSHAHVSSGPMLISPAVPCSRLQWSHAHVSSSKTCASPHRNRQTAQRVSLGTKLSLSTERVGIMGSLFLVALTASQTGLLPRKPPLLTTVAACLLCLSRFPKQVVGTCTGNHKSN